MSQTLILPDDVYARLNTAARMRGLTIEQLLQAWPPADQAAAGDALARATALGDELSARYGAMPDSTDLVRADRALNRRGPSVDNGHRASGAYG